MEENFGNFIELEETHEYLIISFSSKHLSVKDHWQTNSLSADFLAAYWGSFFPAHDKSSPEQRDEVKDSVSFIINELLENALKFSYTPSGIPIKLKLCLLEKELIVYVTNSFDAKIANEFQQFIKDMLSGDPGEMYINQLEANVEDDSSSHLGLLTLLNDYEAELAWKFNDVQERSDCMTVTTMVRLDVVRAD